MDKERKQFPEMDATHVKGVANTAEMATRDLEHSINLPDKGLAEFERTYSQFGRISTMG